VDVAGVATVPGASGQALILLQDNGDNSIILIGGANRSWTGVPQAMTTALHGAGMLLLQREIPEAINRAAIRAAHAAGVPVLLDAGGDEGSLPADLLADLALLSPNETELARLTGLPTATDAQVETAARTLLAQDVRAVLVKLGARGSLLVRPGQAPLATPSFRVPVVDTTGAGDCFTAAYAVGRVAGLDDHTALRRASAAAAWCVTQRGALTAMPTTTQVEEILAGQKGPSA
jgi:ribokinase